MEALSLIDTWPVEQPAAGVTGPSGLLGVRGPSARVYRLASVSKPLLAWAILVAVEEGSLSLDRPAGPEGSTVRHLLAHASGLPFEGRAPVAPPGRRRIYSNAGFEVLGEVLSEATGFSTAEYLREAVLDPLGMTSTTLTQNGSPATGVTGTLVDLLAFGRELLVPRLVSAATHRAATAVAFPGLSGILPGVGRFDRNTWGLGVEIRGDKRPHWTGAHNSTATFGHFGGTGTFLWVDPVAGLACAVLTDREFEEWGLAHWPSLSDAVLEEYGTR
jgi:CubicO group peptidase (beta-lactamase class C family)